MTFARTALIGGLATLVAPMAMAQDAATSDLPIAVQMYTLRDLGSVEEQFRFAADSGFQNVETVGTLAPPSGS